MSGEGPLGLQLDGYEWGERLGRGGFSVVYRARQIRLDRDVAIKVLTTDLSDPADRRRFETECRLMGRLGTHPHIVDVHDAGIGSGGEPYIVMKYYSGGTLAGAVAHHGPMAVETVIGIGIKLSDALTEAHDAGVIHRDIKAENVLLDEQGQPVMTDFGVAAVADPEGRYTSSMAFSRAYVAPEVLDRNQYGVASDIYSLGATLYTLLTGRPVFQATTEARTVLAVLQDPPAPLGRTDVPPELEALLLQCLDKNPANRPASASGVRTALASHGASDDLATDTSVAPSPAVSAGDARDTAVEELQTTRRPPVTALDGEHLEPTVLAALRAPEATVMRPSGTLAETTGAAGPSSTWLVTTLAGGRGQANGRGSRAGFFFPSSLSIRADGTIVIADTLNFRIRLMDQDDRVTVLPTAKSWRDSRLGTTVWFDEPSAVAATDSGTIIVAEPNRHQIRRVEADGSVVTVAGSQRGLLDSRGADARFCRPEAVASARPGWIAVADTGNHRIRRIDTDGTVTTIAGSSQGHSDGPANTAQFDSPRGIAITEHGHLIVADTGNHRIRRIARS